MFGYIYLTENLINGKKYIGQHCSECFDSKYFGSGKILRQAIKKYGKENFKINLLCECNSQDELDEKERFYINQYGAAGSDDFYNVALGGKMCQLLYQTSDTKKKISEANRGKVRTPEMNKVNSDRRKGFKWMNNGESQTTVFKEDINEYVLLGWKFGMLSGRKSSPASDIRKRNISDALKGKKKSRSAIEKHRQSLLNKKRHWYTNGVDCLCISEGDPIPNGYYRGRLCSEEAKLKNRESHLGRTPWNKKQ